LNAEQAKIAHLVAKDKIAESGDYNLSGDRYRENVKIQNSKFKIVELGEVCEIEKGTSITKAKITNGDIPVVAGGQQPAYYHNQSNRDGQTITVSASGAYAGFINFFEIPIFASDCTTIKSKDENNLLTKFVFHFLKTRQKDIYKLQKGMGQPHVYGKDLAKIKIPLPPIEVQKEIVEQIEVKQKAIEAAKAVIKNLERERRYFGQAIRKIEGVEWVEFEKIIKTITPPAKIQKSKFGKVGKYPIIDQSQESISGWTDDERLLVKVKNPVVIFGDHTCVVKYSEKQFVQGADGIKILETNEKLLPKFFYYFLKANPIESEGYKRHFSKLRKIKIPLPSLETQKQLVAEMEEQEKIIEANKKLVGIMEQKISDVLSEI
jgi:type I restriction enzyme M protein